MTFGVMLPPSNLPPHFPQPGFDPIVELEAALIAKDEIIARLYAEAKARQTQLEDALGKLTAAERKMAAMEQATTAMIDVSSITLRHALEAGSGDGMTALRNFLGMIEAPNG